MEELVISVKMKKIDFIMRFVCVCAAGQIKGQTNRF